MSNSVPLTRSRPQQAAGDETKSASKVKRNNSTRTRPVKAAIKVFQDAPLATPSKDLGSVRTTRALRPSSTNTLVQTPSNDAKALKGDVERSFKKPIDDKPCSTPAKTTRAAVEVPEGRADNKENASTEQNEQLSRILARRLLSPPSSQQQVTPVRNGSEVEQSLSSTTDHDLSSFATPPQPIISYTDLLTPLLSRSKIPTLNPITNVADLFLPLSISPLALSQAYVNSLNSIASAAPVYQSPLFFPDSSSYGSLQQEMCPPATNVSTHRLDRSPKAKMRYSPSREQWFAVDEETGSPRVAKEDAVSFASPGSPNRRGGQLKMSGAQLLERKVSKNGNTVRVAQHVELGRGFPSPLAKGIRVGTPTKSTVDDKKDLDDVRRLREASLEFDFVRATSSPLSSKARNSNITPRIRSDIGLAASHSGGIQATTSMPSSFAEFLAKTRVVSEPLPTTTTDDEDDPNALRSASSRRRSKRKKAKLPVPEPESDPLSWDALQQKFVQAQVSEEYETIRSIYEQLEAEAEGKAEITVATSLEEKKDNSALGVADSETGVRGEVACGE